MEPKLGYWKISIMRGVFGSKTAVILKIVGDIVFSEPKKPAPKALVGAYFLKYLLICLHTFFLVNVFPSLQ